MNLNPLDWYFSWILPKSHKDQADLLMQKIRAFLGLMSLIVGTYSLAKWSAIGYDQIVNSAIFYVTVIPIITLLFKYEVLPNAILSNALVAVFAFYSMALVYYLGGIYSSHVFWIPGTIIAAYLLTGQISGMIWVGIMFLCTIYFIYAEVYGIELPQFELSEKERIVDRFSGFALPVFMIGAAQAYILKIRTIAMQDAAEALEEARAQTATSSSLSEQLINIFQQASIGSETLVASAGKLSDTTNNMNDRSQHIQHGIDTQVKSTNEVNQTLDEMAKKVVEITQVMTEVRDRTSHSEDEVASSAEAMQQTISFMNEIKTSTEAISDYMQVITGIADQTNLLALNAAIEAARAGQHGRGFAVVADEVRALSVRTNEAADVISGLLKEAEDKVVEGVRLVNFSGGKLNGVVDLFKEISDEVKSTSNQMTSQSSDIEGILGRSKQLEEICDENSSAADELTEYSNNLTIIAEDLISLSKMMKETVSQMEGHAFTSAVGDNTGAGEADLF